MLISEFRNYEGKSAASFCHQVATLVPDKFCNFCLVKNHKIANGSTTTKAREKIRTDLESSNYRNFYVHLTKFKNYPILLNKIGHRFLTDNQAIYIILPASLPALSACLPCQPACFVSLPALSACLPCQLNLSCQPTLPCQTACLVSLPVLSACLLR
jgi:hypothetical protein